MFCYVVVVFLFILMSLIAGCFALYLNYVRTHQSEAKRSSSKLGVSRVELTLYLYINRAYSRDEGETVRGTRRSVLIRF